MRAWKWIKVSEIFGKPGYCIYFRIDQCLGSVYVDYTEGEKEQCRISEENHGEK